MNVCYTSLYNVNRYLFICHRYWFLIYGHSTVALAWNALSKLSLRENLCQNWMALRSTRTCMQPKASSSRFFGSNVRLRAWGLGSPDESCRASPKSSPSGGRQLPRRQPSPPTLRRGIKPAWKCFWYQMRKSQLFSRKKFKAFSSYWQKTLGGAYSAPPPCGD